MKSLPAYLLLLLSVSSAAAQSTASKLDSLFTAYASLNKFNGNVMITRNGQKVFERSYGYRDIEKNSRLRGEETFQIASLTKTFTAVLILKLIEDGKLSLDSRLTDFFPAVHPEKNITVAQLLNHTSGIREVLRSPSFHKRISSGGKTDRRELLAYFSTEPLDFEPGSQYAYSNSGYDLLGFIIEQITHKDYGHAVESYLFRPLGMTGSGFDYAAFRGKKKTVGYAYISPTRHELAPVWDWSWTSASGGLFTTVKDLLTWNGALKENKIISAESLEKSYQPIKGDYGLGWFVESFYGKKTAYHPGNLEGATSYFGRIPQDDICIIMLSNQTSTWLESIAAKIIAVLYNQPYTLPKAKQEIQLPAEMLNSYLGKYDISADYETVLFLQENQLYLQTAGGKPFRIYAESSTKFFAKDSNMNISIDKDSSGKRQLVIRDGLSSKSGEQL